MIKRKINLLILAGVSLLYIICLGISYTTCESIIAYDFMNENDKFEQGIHSYVQEITSNEEQNGNIGIRAIFKSATDSRNCYYPYALTVYNNKGEIVIKIQNNLYGHLNESIYKRFNKNINSTKMKEEAILTLSQKNGDSGYAFHSSDEYEDTRVYQWQGEWYYSYLQISHNTLFSVISSYEFRYNLVIQTILFAIMTIMFIVVANKSYNKSKEVSTAKETFTSAAAHELKTPLAIIQNQCEFVIEDVNPDKNKEYIASIYGESLRMNKLVARLLQYNRLASASKVSKAEVNLSDIANEEVDKYSSMHDIRTNICENAVINANMDLIALAIDNYLSNAVKYSRGMIKVTLAPAGKGYRLSVFTEGTGIDDEHRKNLWDVFYRTDKSRASSSNSTGMGLAICKQIFELHKFKYGYENSARGVEFYFYAR